MVKLGHAARGTLYIQLVNFPSYYLVLVIMDDQFRYALITTRILTESTYSSMIMEDIAWLDFGQIHGEEITVTAHPGRPDLRAGMKRKRDSVDIAMDAGIGEGKSLG
jgi:mediator of RNA polymerase II transcription subunit 14